MPPSTTTTLAPKGKQGKSATFADIKADGQVSGTFFADTDTFSSYSYGLKGKTKDYTIFGSADDQYLVTGDGNDTIDMVGGNNIVVSGAGNDWIKTTSGSNYIDGGAGTFDTYVMDSGYDGEVDLSTGIATKYDPVTGADLGTSDRLFNIENVVGNSDDNVIIGDDGNNSIYTGGGTDTVYGGGGNDRIYADTQYGSKIFVGGTGDDTIFAGEDADEFYWAAGDGADTVYYFDATDIAGTGDALFLDLVGDQTGKTLSELLNSFLKIIDNGGSTTIQIDVTGGGNFDAASSITLDGSYTVLELEGNIFDSTSDVPIG